ncbi:NAD(P)H-hydrate epimerase [Amnibacterium flavum]|uniref:NAD(P)H-hydrate epimerase n=2 Tax=Amnibacterium flavum TaxID=2173173 RepID=A0A2V1HTD1_9MICO|nr:NAD(P)H-hydrate epimerase [Amnibacterium flavum]
MQRAAAGLAAVTADALGRRAQKSSEPVRQRIVILTGPGNNGGDALYAGAELAKRGTEVVVAPISERLHPEALAAARRAGATVLAVADVDAALAAADGADGADAILDGLFGTGSAGRPTPSLSGPAAALVAALLPILDRPNRPTVIAVDIPSGIDADTGAVDGPVLPADVTVTFGAFKAGLLREPAASLTGRIELVDIGLADQLARVVPLLRR